MMKEIIRNGALNAEFQAPNIFASYTSGLLTQDGFDVLHMLSQKDS